ncbi:MAG: O-antigen ligase family protein [Bacteroidales bacterium]|nr:O-antigen ligase family protein [Bacteroidales bacterium]
MRFPELQIKAVLEKTGFWSLFATLFLLSFPRSWSLYTLGSMLFTGLLIWVIDFANIFRQLLKVRYIVLPAVVYFIIHLISILHQNAGLPLLENRLMFLLIPILGFPIFRSRHAGEKVSSLFYGYVAGITGISIFLLIRIAWLIWSDFPGGVSFFSWLNQDELSYLSIGFSVLENPSYLAMKINWVLILLLFSGRLPALRSGLVFVITLFLSAALLFAASKAGLTIWFIVILAFLIINLGKIIRNKILYCGVIVLFILAAITMSMRIQRVNDFILTTKSRIGNENFQWKNLDQRTRVWYSAIQIIKMKPVFGTGLSKAEESLVDEYIKNGFNDEAELRLNSHNQFLEAQMTFGIAGTISLITMLSIPFFMRRRTYFPGLTKFFILLFSFQLVFESMLNRQWGIMFFLLFYFILSITFLPSDTVPSIAPVPSSGQDQRQIFL